MSSRVGRGDLVVTSHIGTRWLGSIAKKQELIRAKPDGSAGAPIPVAKLHFEGPATVEDFYDSSYLATPEVDLREIAG